MRRLVAWLALALALVAGTSALAAPQGDAHGEAAHAEASHAEGHEAEGHGPPLLAKLFNTVLFFGLLGWFAGPWLVAWFRTRKGTIENELSAAQRAREEAEARLAEMDARLTEVEAEVQEILGTAGRQAEAERERILAAARVEAERVVAQAEVRVAELESQAARRLRESAADLAVGLARELVTKQLDDADRARLQDQYLESLKKVAG
jgi:F-type H+-transporting ATPase subunit b